MFATYFADIPLSTSPYPFFMGLKRTGKTRALEVLAQLCFRAKMAISISGAAIPTNVKLIHPTLLVDEASLMDEEKRPLILKMFLAYRPDMYYERKNPKGLGFDQLDVSECFCYKAIASRRDLSANLADRCVYINMKKRSRKLKRWRRSMYETEAKEIRTQLLELRMRYWNTLEEDEDFTVRDDRVEELFIPLATMAKRFGPKKAYDDIKAAAEAVITSFEREKAMSFEHDVIEAIVTNRLSISDDGLLPTTTIADNLFKEAPTPGDFRKLSGTLKSLGFEKVYAKYGGKKKRCVVVDETLLERYVEDYGIEEQKETPFKPRDVVRLARLHPAEKGKCVYCGNETTLDFQAEAEEGTWGHVCVDCASLIKKENTDVEWLE